MGWLSNVLDHYYISQGKPLPFEMVVYDEVTRVKNSNSQRVAGGNITRQKLFVRQPHEMSEQQMKGAGLKGKALREEKELVTARNIQRYEELRRQFPRNKDDMINQHGELVVVPEIKEKIIGWREMSKHFKYTTGLTGTPSSNGYIDLHGQYLVIDNGERLGPYVSHYRDSYFSQGYDGWTYELTEVGKTWIEHKIADITIKMDSEDYLTLPPLKINDIMVDLPPKVMQQYREVEKDMFTRLDDGTEIELFNRASVSNKCLQFCNGSPYNEPLKPEWTALHDEKLQALDSIIEEAQGKTILLGYSFKSDAERIMKRYKHLKPINLTKVPAKDLSKVIDQGNKGGIKLMLGHPACLHPETQVLTERHGWVRIIDVELSDRVFDGVEFVSHDGCSYSGYKDVIDALGVTMTHNHKILINDEWVEAKDVQDSEEVRRKALYKYEGDDKSISEMFELQSGISDPAPECNEEQQTEECGTQRTEKTHVYDLVNCGPRHRFVIRNEHGECFVSHNSLGHGVDGLNDFCHIIVWFGLNWSLELYEQLIGRIASGQRFKHPVTMHRILCNDTIDLAVADALRRKDSDQVGLKKAIQRYRDGVLNGPVDFM
jgi:hypothetical protein